MSPSLAYEAHESKALPSPAVFSGLEQNLVHGRSNEIFDSHKRGKIDHPERPVSKTPFNSFFILSCLPQCFYTEEVFIFFVKLTEC